MSASPAASGMDTETFRQFLLEFADRETATTLKVLEAFPVDRSELKPHPVMKSARELAWLCTLQQRMSIAAIDGTIDLSAPPPAPPETFGEVVDSFERTRRKMLDRLRSADEDQLAGTVRFPVGPKRVGEMARLELVHFMLLDQIHHRGQLSVYLRQAGGKVPSIYGPTADERWV